MIKKILILLLNFFIFAAYCNAAQIEFESKVDKKTLDVNDVLTLTIILSGDYKSTPKIEIPSLEDFDILATSSSSSINLEGKKTSSTTKITYLLQPKITGEITIGPAKIKYHFRTYKTKSIKIIVAGQREQAPEEQPQEEYRQEQVTL